MSTLYILSTLPSPPTQDFEFSSLCFCSLLRPFCIIPLVLGVQHELEYNQPRVTSLKKTDTPSLSPSSYWVNSFSASGGILCPPSFPPHWDFMWFGLEYVWLMLSQLPWVHIFNCYVQENTTSLMLYLWLLYLTNFLPPISQWSLSLRNKEWHIVIPFMDENSAVSYSLHVDQSCLSKLMSIYCKEKHFWWVLSDALIYKSF